MIRRPPRSTLFPSRRSSDLLDAVYQTREKAGLTPEQQRLAWLHYTNFVRAGAKLGAAPKKDRKSTSELQSQSNLVCRLLLEKKKNKKKQTELNNKIEEIDTV